jgi:hypothetical protein
MRASWIVLSLLIGQVPAVSLPNGVTRLAGVDATSGITYALISLEGKAVGAAPVRMPSPRLTAQCTQTPDGKRRFELLADLGGVPELVYYPPWKPKTSSEFPPQLVKAQVTMEFLGYTRVKPVKRQWESLDQLPNELRYSTPGLSSGNMEPINFYLQYLRALPTLRLTVPGKGTAEWETAGWQQAVHAEPLCSASGL